MRKGLAGLFKKNKEKVQTMQIDGSPDLAAMLEREHKKRDMQVENVDNVDGKPEGEKLMLVQKIQAKLNANTDQDARKQMREQLQYVENHHDVS